ncbi:MAG: winged helix-turn-helix transcriptional regulator [Deltaproteobacteria bacterium]
MNSRDEHSEDYRSLLLLDEISKNNEVTQRDLSKKLGVALGLINSYLKNLASKGYITVSGIPRKRYSYYVTANGFTEKTRLTYQHLRNFTNLYKVARRDFSLLFNSYRRSDIKRIVFCGNDEVSEIAYLSLKEAGLDLTAIIDAASAGKKFFGLSVLPLEAAASIESDVIVITSFQSGAELKNALVALGVKEEKICFPGATGWLKRMGV